MFILMQECNLARVRSIRYVNGKLDSVLADWDVWNLQDEFYEKKYFDTEYEVPFYCLFKVNGVLFHPTDYSPLMKWAENEAKGWEGHTPQELYDSYVQKAKALGCPIFENEEEAQKYVFQNRYLKV